ncbi:type II toxin-antitoxin system RelE/ParE family toxin [Phosphitispora fastidiosa]|uniref:type II toxin-antitoxin system RelE/ParE family toxin n=1 Tax=Phosphitispora fastidiosa TaxID=2837202 RepID=UPI001E560E06|nr:type II toxin-antitoxin system RelE/ParE family toxin [Phosphitispora fastidiosa]MBU7006032.1 toxin ParE1/3/4 [Phosphitispora fastidiosa]
MPRRSRVKYAPAAVDDMDEIFSYISKDNAAAAESLLDKLNDDIGNLAEFPNMGSVLSEDEFTLVNRGYRFIVIHPYLVFYRIIKNTVIIHRILHSRRDYIRELFSIEE